jgi:hypothetical protein
MHLYLASLLVCAGLEGHSACWGFLSEPSFCQDAPPRAPAEPYLPQPGDIFLAWDRQLLARFFHKIAGADSLHHSGIIIELPDGQPAILEAGPHNTLRVRILDVFDHLHSHEWGGDKVWIRRRCTPLTPEQSACLTHFALAQNGKRFAALRLVGQLTPFRSRGPLRTRWLGAPHGERRSYFCSELVAECCVVAGLLEASRTRPAATYPCDLFYGRSHNPFLDRHLDINDDWLPPARWSSCPPEAAEVRPESDSLINAGNAGRR